MTQRQLPAPRTSGKKTGVANLRRGNPGNKGGGRNKSSFTKLCQDLIDKYELVQRAAKMGAGENVLQFKALNPDTGQPETVYAPARAQDQLKAIEFVTSYAHGAPPQHVTHEGDGVQYVMVTPRMPATIEEWRKMFAPSKS